MNVLAIIGLSILAGWMVIGILGAVTMVGKERKPLTPGGAAGIVIAQLGFIAIVIISIIAVSA